MAHPPFISVTALLCVVMFAVPAYPGAQAQVASIASLQTDEIPPEFLKYSAVILLDDEHVKISGNTAIQERRIVKKILKSGCPEEGAFRFGTSDARKILEINARAVYPDGRERVLSPDDIIIVPDFEGFVLYSDQKSYSFRIPGLVAGTVIEVTVKRKLDQLVYWEPALFQGDVPILKRSYTLVHPDDQAITVHGACMSDTPSSSTIPSRGMRQLVWEQRDIKPLRPENMMPPLAEYLPALWFSVQGSTRLGTSLSLDSWSGVVEWYRRIAEESLRPGARLRSVLDSLSVPGASEKARAASVLRWVQTNLRYVAIILGDGGFRPHETEDVLANRYGDCKDMSTVLTAALRELGIEAHLVLVRTADLGRVPGAAPSPFRFNHAIVTAVADGDTVYLDPTCDTCGFGILPDHDQGAEALVIRGGEDKLTILPSGLPRPDRLDVSAEASIASNGDAGVAITMKFDGYPAAVARRRLGYREGRSTSDAVAVMLKADIPSLRLDSVMIDGADPASDVLTITTKGTIPGMLDMERQYSSIRCVLTPLATGCPDCENRLYPVALGTPGFLEYDISIELPEDWRVVDAPHSGEIRSGYFDYRYSGDADGRNVRFSRRWSNAARIVPAAECRDIRAQLKAIGDMEATQILVEHKQ